MGDWMLDTGCRILDGAALFRAHVRAFHGLDEHVDLLAEAIKALVEIVVEWLVA
jgi:hypothetical protein